MGVPIYSEIFNGVDSYLARGLPVLEDTYVRPWLVGLIHGQRLFDCWSAHLQYNFSRQEVHHLYSRGKQRRLFQTYCLVLVLLLVIVLLSCCPPPPPCSQPLCCCGGVTASNKCGSIVDAGIAVNGGNNTVFGLTTCCLFWIELLLLV